MAFSEIGAGDWNVISYLKPYDDLELSDIRNPEFSEDEVSAYSYASEDTRSSYAEDFSEIAVEDIISLVHRPAYGEQWFNGMLEWVPNPAVHDTFELPVPTRNSSIIKYPGEAEESVAVGEEQYEWPGCYDEHRTVSRGFYPPIPTPEPKKERRVASYDNWKFGDDVPEDDACDRMVMSMGIVDVAIKERLARVPKYLKLDGKRGAYGHCEIDSWGVPVPGVEKAPEVEVVVCPYILEMRAQEEREMMGCRKRSWANIFDD